MFQIKLKTTIEIDIGQRIVNELRADGAFIGADKFARIQTDCETLQQLRANIIQPNTPLIHLEKYFCALQATNAKFPLPNFQFAWSNSLGFSNALVQSNGLWFEILNVAYNIAAKLTQMVTGDAKSWLKAAGMFVHTYEHLIPAEERDKLPPELQPCTLKFLANLCLAQALDLGKSDTAAAKWAIAKSYGAVLEQLAALPMKILQLEEIYEARIKILMSEAFLAVGKELIHSRKKSDLALAKSALSQCLQINSRSREVNDEALAMLRMPVNRRSKAMIGDIESNEEFSADSYFPAQTGTSPILWTPSDPALKALFNYLPPSHLWPLPALVKYRLSLLVHKYIADKYRTLNQNVRNTAVKANLPVAVEVLQKSTCIPPTLISYGETITRSGGSKALDIRFSECLASITLLDEKLRERLSNWPSLKEIEAFSAKIKQAELLHKDLLHHWRAVKRLVKVLESGSDAIVEYLNLTGLKSTPGGSQPIFLTKVQEVWSKISKSMAIRESVRTRVLTKLDQLPVDEAVQRFINANDSTVTLKFAFSTIASQLWDEFVGDLTALEESTSKSQLQIKALKDLSGRFAKMHKPSSTYTARLVRSQALTGAWATWNDLNDKVNDLASNLAALDLPLQDLINRSCVAYTESHPTSSKMCRLFERSEPRPAVAATPKQFAWKPGKTVNIV